VKKDKIIKLLPTILRTQLLNTGILGDIWKLDNDDIYELEAKYLEYLKSIREM